jgi:hypothetical protein
MHAKKKTAPNAILNNFDDNENYQDDSRGATEDKIKRGKVPILSIEKKQQFSTVQTKPEIKNNSQNRERATAMARYKS